MDKYIITGGAGFIGSNLAKRLLAEGNKVYLLDDLSTGLKTNISEGAVFYETDIADIKKLLGLDIPDGIDAVYHLAAQSSGESSFEDPARDIDINYKGTYNLLKLAEKKKCRRFIYASSMSVYGQPNINKDNITEDDPCNPLSYYGCNKLASEKLIQVFAKNASLKSTIFRLFSVYGPGQNMLNAKQGIVSIYLSYLLKNERILVKGSLNRFRDLVYIDDVLDVFISCMDNDKCYYQVFNLGTGIKTTVRAMLELMLELYGKNDFKKWVAVKGSTTGDTTGCVADLKKLYRATGWKPKHDLKYGLGSMKSWLDKTSGVWLEAERSRGRV